MTELPTFSIIISSTHGVLSVKVICDRVTYLFNNYKFDTWRIVGEGDM